jgi:hypothetical protein
MAPAGLSPKCDRPETESGVRIWTLGLSRAPLFLRGVAVRIVPVAALAAEVGMKREALRQGELFRVGV